jgi:hypothetical protein
MNINHVTLDNGTVISYGFDEETGDVDHSTITIETETEIVAIRPKNTVHAVGDAIQVETILRIDFLDELDEDCGNLECPRHNPQAAS